MQKWTLSGIVKIAKAIAFGNTGNFFRILPPTAVISAVLTICSLLQLKAA
jgi:hypothetical protein